MWNTLDFKEFSFKIKRNNEILHKITIFSLKICCLLLVVCIKQKVLPNFRDSIDLFIFVEIICVFCVVLQ